MTDFRALRSYLFVPLGDEKILSARSYIKAAKESDVLILDLEDSLAMDRKSFGRILLPKAIEHFAKVNPHIIVRINNEADQWTQDTEVSAHPLVQALLVPKAESAEHIERVQDILSRMRSKAFVIPLLETPLGILNCAKICTAGKRAPCAVFGSEDLATSLGVINPTHRNMLYAAANVILNCAALNIPVIGTAGSFSSYQTETLDEFLETLKFSREIGFSGALAVDRRQVPAINSVFSYDDERERLETILRAGEGKLPVYGFEGRMYGPPMVKRYQRLRKKFQKS